MNYKESKLILKEVKKAKSILLNCHRGPDPDSIGSALAMLHTLVKMGKKVEIVCPSEELYNNVDFLKDYNKIKRGVDFQRFDYSKYELFITLDSSSWYMVTGLREILRPDIKVIVIDHHLTNDLYGNINLVDEKSTSVGELLYKIFEDWKIKPDKDTAEALLTAILGDTGSFRFPGTTSESLKVGADLIELGADKDMINFNIYQRVDFKLVKFYGNVLTSAKLDKKYKFIWSAIPYEVYKKLGNAAARETSASYFAQITEGTDFGIVMTEEEKKKLSVSMRSRTGFDTSKIAVELGGGGHIYASGAKVEGLPYEKAVEKVLQVARKHAKIKKGS